MAQPQPLPAEIHERAGAPDDGAENEATFTQSWGEELINRTWVALTEAKPAYHAVLVFHVQNPKLPSAGVAEQLSARLGKPFTAAHVRVAL